MKKTLIYIDNLERYSFYIRLIEVLKENKEFIIITNKLSVYLKVKIKYKTYFLKNVNIVNGICSEGLDSTLSVSCGYHTIKQAQRISISVNDMMKKIVEENKVDNAFVFNGTTTIGKSIGDFCKNNDIKIKFIEISNLPNKLFIDNEGTNALSYLYKHPELLDKYQVSDQEFLDWKNSYIKNKLSPKQAKNRTKIRYMIFFDYLGFWFLNALQEDFRNPFHVIKNKLLNRLPQTFNEVNLERKYIFFPLQVSNDSQLILNSDVDNLKAIEIIKAKYMGKRILIKPHPAEENYSFLSQIESMQDENIIIVANNTNELIKKAQKVVTINSTVGLEAMIFEKEVEVLGRALYANFTQERLKSYICRYLINIDYFNGSISSKEAERLYEK